MVTTPQRILDTARRLFNDRGLARVGVREIAREVGITVGNLGYHFATKDELIAALLVELRDLNVRTAFVELPRTIPALYQTAVVALRNMLPYRFVLLSYVEAFRASPDLLALHGQFLEARRRRSLAMLDALVDNGRLDRRATAARAARIFEQGELISSGWLAAAALQPDRFDDDTAARHYARLGCALLEPCCTPIGLRELSKVLSGAAGATARPPPSARGSPDRPPPSAKARRRSG